VNSWRRHWVSIALVILAALLGVYLFVIDRGTLTTGEKESRKRNLLSAFRRNEISTVAIEPRGGAAFRIVARQGDYVLTRGGAEEPADRTAVDRLIGALEFATRERPVEGADRQALGLDAPRVRVTVAMGSITYRVAVGQGAPVPEGAAYAELAGEGVFVVPRELVAELEQPVDAYRARRLVPYLVASLREIRLDGPAGERRLSRGAWGGFAVTSPSGAVRVDRDAFERIVGALADLRADVFPPDEEAERSIGPAPDRVRVELLPSDGAQPKATVEIGGTCPGHPEEVTAIRREPAPRISACVPKAATEPLSTPRDRLEDRHLFSLRPDEMEEIALTSGDKQLDLARKDVAWHMRAPSDTTVDIDTGNGLAIALAKLTAERVLGPESPDAGSETVRTTARVTRGGGASADAGAPPSETVVVIEGGRKLVAHRLEDGAWLELSADVARALVPSAVSTRSRKVVDVPAMKVRKIAVETREVRQSLVRSATGAWTLDDPRGFEVDAGLAGDVADAVARLSADRWVAEADDGRYGLERPRGRVRIDVEPGDAGAPRIEIALGAATSGGVFAQKLGDPAVFVLPQATLRTLETWTIDRSYLALPEGALRIHLATGKSAWALDAQSDAGDRFARVKAAASDLRAEAAVHPGPPRAAEGFGKPQAELAIEGPEGGPIQVTLGAGDVWRGMNVVYARRKGVDATFVVAQSRVRPLLDLD
jgi:Domain of unknown function (DUF4340)